MLEHGTGKRGKPIGSSTTTESEWVGGRLTTPMFITEGERYRLEMILWLEVPDGYVVGHEAIDPHVPVTFAETLVRTMKKPAVGAPRRPRRVRVAEERLAVELRAAVPDLKVVVAPTPELDALLEHMTQSMPPGDEDESYLEKGRVSAESVARLFRAAQLLWRVAPWKVAFDAQVVRVDIPQMDLNGACLSIIGNLGQSYGLLLFPSLEAFHALARAAVRHPQGPRDLGTNILALNFERGADLPESMRREIAKHGWPVAGADAYPRVEHRDRDGLPRPLTERDVSVMTAVATSFGAFFAKHRKLFAVDEPDPVCESYFDDLDVEVRFTVPYDAQDDFEIVAPPRPPAPRFEPKTPRNSPCPCGSGKKYKKCCLLKDEAAAAPGSRAPIHEADERLVFEMMHFAERRFGSAWRRSWRDFADAEAGKQLHRPWAVYCFLVDGRPVVDWFLDERGTQLVADERGWLAAQKRAWMGIWEVAAVQPGKSVTVRDLLSGEERTVREVSGSKMLRARDTILGRVVDHDGLSVFAGIHPRPLTPMLADVVVRSARRRLGAKAAVPVERLRDEPCGRHLIKRWERAVAEMDAHALVPQMLHNTDGDPLLMTTDHFAFDPSKRDEVQAGLCAIEGVERPDKDDADPGFTFLRPGNAMHKQWENTVVGRAMIAHGELRLETNSIPRADDLRRRVEARLGELVRHRAREHADPLAPRNRPESLARPAPEIPPGEQARILGEYKEQHYAAWLDQPIPALAGKSPREAARTKAGRAKVDLLLKDMENHEARLPDGARFDFSRLRAELHLEP